MKRRFSTLLPLAVMAASFSLPLAASAQTSSRSSDTIKTEEADISKMGHFKLRSYLKEHGYKTPGGHMIRIGDTLVVGKGSLPDKRFAFIYQAPTAFGSNSSPDGSQKAYLNSSAGGRKAIVKAFMTSGMRKGEYAVFPVVGVGEMINYWVEVDNAVDAGELIIPNH